MGGGESLRLILLYEMTGGAENDDVYGWNLPLGNGTVLMPPDGIFPVVGRPVFLLHQLPVDLHAQSRAAGKLHESVGKCEIFRISDIIQHAFAHIVMDADALFLDDRIIAGGIYVQAGGQRNGP